jgi:hypothetical protein
VAAGDATKEIIWLRGMLQEMHYPQSQPTTLLCDNDSAIAIASNSVQHDRTKHIDIRHHFIRDHIKRGDVALQWVSTKDQEADILTKTLGKHPFQMLRDRVTGISQSAPVSVRSGLTVAS